MNSERPRRAKKRPRRYADEKDADNDDGETDTRGNANVEGSTKAEQSKRVSQTQVDDGDTGAGGSGETSIAETSGTGNKKASKEKVGKTKTSTGEKSEAPRGNANGKDNPSEGSKKTRPTRVRQTQVDDEDTGPGISGEGSRAEACGTGNQKASKEKVGKTNTSTGEKSEAPRGNANGKVNHSETSIAETSGTGNKKASKERVGKTKTSTGEKSEAPRGNANGKVNHSESSKISRPKRVRHSQMQVDDTDTGAGVSGESASTTNTNFDDRSIALLTFKTREDRQSDQTSLDKSWKRDFDDNLSCPVCLENFIEDRIPKDLDCPHVCCIKCLNDLTSEIKGVKCPLCQIITSLPEGGADSLRTNLVVRSLAETLHMYKEAEAQAEKNKGNMCSQHGAQVVLFFCRTCNMPICQYCIINDHAKHKFEPIQSLITDQKGKLERAMQKVKSQVEKCEKFDEKITEHQEMLSSNFQKAESEIDDHIKSCIDEINKQGQQLKDKLHELKLKQLKGVQNQSDRHRRNLQDKNQVLSDVQNTLETASDSVYLVMHDKMFHNLKTVIADDTFNAVKDVNHENENGFRLEIGSWSVNLGIDLVVEQPSESEHNTPSTSGRSPEDHSGQGDAGPFKKRFSTKRIKLEMEDEKIELDEEDEEEIVCLSDENAPNIFDLTTDSI